MKINEISKKIFKIKCICIFSSVLFYIYYLLLVFLMANFEVLHKHLRKIASYSHKVHNGLITLKLKTFTLRTLIFSPFPLFSLGLMLSGSGLMQPLSKLMKNIKFTLQALFLFYEYLPFFVLIVKEIVLRKQNTVKHEFYF